jgi:hypothetical protein
MELLVYDLPVLAYELPVRAGAVDAGGRAGFSDALKGQSW